MAVSQARNLYTGLLLTLLLAATARAQLFSSFFGGSDDASGNDTQYYDQAEDDYTEGGTREDLEKENDLERVPARDDMGSNYLDVGDTGSNDDFSTFGGAGAPNYGLNQASGTEGRPSWGGSNNSDPFAPPPYDPYAYPESNDPYNPQSPGYDPYNPQSPGYDPYNHQSPGYDPYNPQSPGYDPYNPQSPGYDPYGSSPSYNYGNSYGRDQDSTASESSDGGTEGGYSTGGQGGGYGGTEGGYSTGGQGGGYGV